MCGITGLLGAPLPEERWRPVLEGMADTLVHRGPDDSGVWYDAAAEVGLAMRRLAIIDLSPTGKQPMRSRSGRYWIVYNGETYNFPPLREELAGLGHLFEGTSDTEVILAAVEEWGLTGALGRCNGMFAMAIWDGAARRLALVRDRVGIKPLYYGWMGRCLVFGSELKALKAYPGFDDEVDPDAVGLFTRLGYIPGPYSIYRRVRKLRPGSVLWVAAGAGPEEALEERYWDVREAVRRGAREPIEDEEEALARLDALLRDAVRQRMIADVPLGAFLSGGVDSSTVVALMQAQSSRPVKTFSIGFHERGLDEAGHAAAVAAHLGTDHTALYVSPTEAREVIPILPRFFDEPFADNSMIPTYLVSRLARTQVTVSLSGDGGDELFFGYGRYRSGWRRWENSRRVPALLRRLVSRGLRSRPMGAAAELLSAGGARGGLRPAGTGLGSQLHKLAGMLDEERGELFYYRLVSKVQEPRDLVPAAAGGRVALCDPTQWAELPAFPQKMMFLDLVSYIPDDILVKLDRASMAVSLEGRVPLLDYRVVELAWRLPLALKYHGGQQKWILRRVLDRYVPRTLMERPKRGFSAPVDQWIRGPLRGWAESLLDEGRLRAGGFFAAEAVRRLWSQHLAGRANHKQLLWNLLMFQAWLEEGAPAARRSAAAR